jgi:hypothetical protein
MKLHELGISTTAQIIKPQSPGSRGIALNKNRPAKRYFDDAISKLKQNKKTDQ